MIYWNTKHSFRRTITQEQVYNRWCTGGEVAYEHNGSTINTKRSRITNDLLQAWTEVWKAWTTYYSSFSFVLPILSSVSVQCHALSSVIIRFVIPIVFIIKLDWSVCTCLTQLYDGRDLYRIYYIKNNHMFRALYIGHLQFEKWKNLVSSYTRLMWVVYSGEVRGGVGTRSHMCYVGWVVWVHGFWHYMLF